MKLKSIDFAVVFFFNSSAISSSTLGNSGREFFFGHFWANLKLFAESKCSLSVMLGKFGSLDLNSVNCCWKSSQEAILSFLFLDCLLLCLKPPKWVEDSKVDPTRSSAFYSFQKPNSWVSILHSWAKIVSPLPWNKERKFVSHQYNTKW